MDVAQPREHGGDARGIARALGQVEGDAECCARLEVPAQRRVGLREMRQGQHPLARLPQSLVRLGRRGPARDGILEAATLERLDGAERLTATGG